MPHTTMKEFITKGNIEDIEPFVYRHRGILECRLNTPVIAREEFRKFLKQLSFDLGMHAHPELPEPVVTSASGHSLDKHNGLEAMLFWLESGLHAYWWEKFQLLTLDLHSCAYLDAQIVHRVISRYFEIVEIRYFDFTPMSQKEDSHKVEVRLHPKKGKAVYAREDILKDEFVAGYYGEIYEAPHALAVPSIAINHAVQFSEYKWRDGVTGGVARYLNHSCEPNCGIKGLHDLVAMREIKAGEELCWDYAMTEDSNWEVPGRQCFCGTPVCRGRIVPYRELTVQEKEKYQDYTSAWLQQKYRAGMS